MAELRDLKEENLNHVKVLCEKVNPGCVEKKTKAISKVDLSALRPAYWNTKEAILLIDNINAW